MKTKFTLKTHNVNNKRILEEVSGYVSEIITNFNITWTSREDRDTILEVIDELLEDMVNDDKIEQWNVVCDGRNNKTSDTKKKTTYLDIEYRQRNCFNITKLNYIIQN